MRVAVSFRSATNVSKNEKRKNHQPTVSEQAISQEGEAFVCMCAYTPFVDPGGDQANG